MRLVLFFFGVINTGQYFSNEALPSKMRDYTTTVLGNTFTFTTDNGVFSKDGLDYGTRLLLENLDLEDVRGDVLDIGCGYGPIGIILGRVTDASITMCDVNRRALHLARMNAKKNHVELVSVVESNCYEGLGDQKFDCIITNPPIRAGKAIVNEIVLNARLHLKEDGTLYLVIRKEQGAKSMLEQLKVYYQVSIIFRKKGFFVIKCKID